MIRHDANQGFRTWCTTRALFLGLFLPCVSQAQTCATPNVHLDTQAEINTFQADHGPCTQLTGDLMIGGISGPSDIDSLGPLAGLSHVGGDLVISETFSLLSLAGLESLSFVGGDMTLFHNFALLEIDALAALERVDGDFTIFANPVQRSIDGLSNLHSTGGMMGVTDLHDIRDIDALASLVSVGSHLLISFNPLLEDLAGLASVSEVGGSVMIRLNDQLESLAGLDALVHVGLALDVRDNASLVSLTGLEAVEHVGANLRIQNNPALTHCRALTRILDAVDHGTPGPGAAPSPDLGGAAYIDGNAPGCRDRYEALGIAAPPSPVPTLALPGLLLCSLAVLAAGLARTRVSERSRPPTRP
ncbi:MAG: hypothetical protein R3348_02805 [Xanthomonadales bacterium]|nr:hypothetical protein [Xanthomonadales bacterium]